MARRSDDLGPEPARPDRAGRLAYDPTLDGLRAVAVVAVVAFHLWPDRVPGGFLGVDTFFVVSGYLITALLLAEHRARGRVDLGSFWARRARRLLPALLVLLVAVSVAAAAWWPAEDLARIRGDALGGLGYVANWRLVLSGDSYFDLVRGPSPLRHLWSLAIEEQFYVVWPLVVVAVLRRGTVRALRVVIAAGAVASVAALAVLGRGTDVSRAYYGTDTRAYALLAGAALATVATGGGVRSNRLLRGLGLGALVLAAVAWFAVGESTHWLFRWGLPVYAVLMLGVLAMLVAQTAPPALSRLLSAAPVVAVGRVSYGLYLWHWPAIVFLSPARTGWHGPGLVALQLGVTVAFTAASYHLVEVPVRHGRARHRAAVLSITGAFAVTAAVVLLATAGARPTPDYLRQAGTVDERPTIVTGPTVAPTTTPPTLQPRRPTHVLFVGDSVAYTFQDELGAELAARGIAFTAATAVGCGAAAGVDQSVGVTADPAGVPTPWADTCARSVPELQAEGLATGPDLVAFYSTWEPSDRVVDGEHVAFGTAAWDGVVATELRAAVDRLTATGAHLVFLTLPPIVDSELHTVTPEENARRVRFNQLVDEVVAASGGRASTVDFAGVVCDFRQPCPRSVGGVELRPLDGGHFEDEGAAVVAARLAPLLAAVDLGPQV